MQIISFVVILWLTCLAPAAFAGEPDMQGSRFIVKTNAGPLQIVLYLKDAPKTVAHLRQAVKNRMYDNLKMVELAPEVLAQFDVKKKEPVKIPVEGRGLKHERGAVSFSPETGALYIILGPVPDMDGRYTVFGRVIESDATLATLSDWPFMIGKPPYPLKLFWSRDMTLPEAKENMEKIKKGMEGMRPLTREEVRKEYQALARWVLCAVVVVSACAFSFARALGARGLLALHLLSLLFGMFGLITLIRPQGPVLGAIAFLALLLLIRIMSTFESTSPQPKK